MRDTISSQGTYSLTMEQRQRLDAVVAAYGGAVSKQAVLRFGIEMGVAALEKDPSALFSGLAK